MTLTGEESSNKHADEMRVGEEYSSLALAVSGDLNEQFLKALDCNSSVFKDFIHPGLIFNFCSITQSPSFHLKEGIAAVGAKFECLYHKPARVGTRLDFEWRVVEVYERRSRTYQTCNVYVKAGGQTIMERRITNTFIGGHYLERRVRWEKDTAYRRSVSFSSFPEQGYEIRGKKRKLSIEQMRLYSGGMPGPEWPARNVHTDREISIRAGIGRPIASGLMFEAYIAELLAFFFGDAFFYGGATKVIAIEMAGDGDFVTPKMVLNESYAVTNSSRECSGDVWCENQYGNRLMLGNVGVPANQGRAEG